MSSDWLLAAVQMSGSNSQAKNSALKKSIALTHDRVNQKAGAGDTLLFPFPFMSL